AGPRPRTDLHLPRDRAGTAPSCPTLVLVRDPKEHRRLLHQALQIVATLLVAVGMALSLAHALELPGKLRLPKETYIAVQTIYYPGFTIGGMVGEFGAMVATLVLLVATPTGGAAFWLTLVAFVALLVMHAIYWLVTHPVNKVWLRDQQMHGAGAA